MNDLHDATKNFDSLPSTAIVRIHTVKAVLSVSAGTVWRLSRRGALRPIRISERVTGWRVGDLRAYLEAARGAQ